MEQHTCKRWEMPAINADLVRAIAHEWSLPRPIAMVLANRGVASDEMEMFLRPRLQHLLDPFKFPDMKAAVERIWKAIKAGERILVHGDYDADGVTSTVLITWVLEECGALVDCFLPNRLEDGYGLTPESVERARTDGYHLLITVDCGITSCEATQIAMDAGIDVIITDHHQPGEEIPNALAVINPRLHPELTFVQGLAGVGVAFKLCHGLIKYGRENSIGGLHIDLREGLDLVALGTVADIVPLLGENRILVRHGMKILSAQRRPGVRALCDLVHLNDRITPEDITYRLAPRLNAAGRMSDPDIALRLLRSRSIVDAYPLADHLDRYNRERQTFEEKAYMSARLQVDGVDIDERYSLIAKGSNWHRGVIGIVASRLTHEFHRPTIVLTIDDDGSVHGSGRSVPGINLVDVLHGCSDFLIRYGGHPMATGLALEIDALPEFERAFEESVQIFCQRSFDFTPTITLEGDATFHEIDDYFFEGLTCLKPFGHSNQAPVFRFTQVAPERVMAAGRDHSRGTLIDKYGQTLSFIAFGRQPSSLPPPPWTIAAIPEINIYRGTANPQLQIVDIMQST